jgi:hypothetical protein
MIPTCRATGQRNDKRVSGTTSGHPARDGDGEKIRAGIPAAARRLSVMNRKSRSLSTGFRLVDYFLLRWNFWKLNDRPFTANDSFYTLLRISHIARFSYIFGSDK